MSVKASQTDIFSRASFCLSQLHRTTDTTPDVYDLTEDNRSLGNPVCSRQQMDRAVAHS